MSARTTPPRRTRRTKYRCLRVPLIGSIAARIVDCVPVDNKGGKAGGSGSEAIAARLLRMFGKEALEKGAVAPRQQEGGEPAEEGGPSNANGTAATRPKLPTAEENWARGWRGNPLLLFPEGTTSNGSCLLRFKTGVFASGVPVYPVTVKFDVRRFSPAFERCVDFRRTLYRQASDACSFIERGWFSCLSGILCVSYSRTYFPARLLTPPPFSPAPPPLSRAR